jgi:hypothetical protein
MGAIVVLGRHLFVGGHVEADIKRALGARDRLADRLALDHGDDADIGESVARGEQQCRCRDEGR